MAAQKKTKRGKPARKHRPGRLESTWNGTRDALRSAETIVGKRVAALVRRSGLEPREVMRQAEAWRARLDREGQKARKRVEARLADLQHRAVRERRVLARAADDAVARALAALNIPSRQEVQQLARRVEQLSTRIGSLRR